MCTGNCNCSCDQITIPSLIGPGGTNGLNAFNGTTAQFTVPAINSNVTISVSDTNPFTGLWAITGQSIFIEDAGYYEVVSSTATSIVAKNMGSFKNTVPGTVVAFGKKVSPAGLTKNPGGILTFDYFNATAGTGSWQLFNNRTQVIDYEDYVLSVNNDTIEIDAFIYTDISGKSTNTSFRFRLDGVALLTTPISITYPPVSKETFKIRITRLNSTTLVFEAKQYHTPTSVVPTYGTTTVYDWSTIGTVTVADLDSPGNYPLSVDFQVNADLAHTLGWQSITSIKK
jgi:hypothetical protein